MKEFIAKHKFFGTEVKFPEDDPPKWLQSDVYNWWWERYVLNLEVNQSTQSEFQIIHRIK